MPTNRAIRWIAVMALLCAAMGCSSDSKVTCERIDSHGEPYCTYQQPITETGYECPQDLPNAIPFEGHTVCSDEEQLPEEHAQPLQDHFADADDSSCPPNACDAYWIPLVTFDFYNPDGTEYCEDVTIRWGEDASSSSADTLTCKCNGGDEPSRDAGATPCSFNPPLGEVIEVAVETQDYPTVETTVELPCECHPTDVIEVNFEEP